LLDCFIQATSFVRSSDRRTTDIKHQPAIRQTDRWFFHEKQTRKVFPMNQFQNGNLFDFESATEVARLLLQDRIMSETIGTTTVFSSFQKRNFRRILDIGCGPGGWAIEMARQNPKSKVIGIDNSPTMITYASNLAIQHGLKNCQFVQIDALKPLEFAELFDLVQICTMGTVIPKVMWSTLLEECYRIMQPGGTLQLIEGEGVLTDSTSLETYSRFCAQFLSHRGYGFSPNGLTLGMTLPVLIQLLQQPGYQDIRSRTYPLDFSAGTTWHEPQRQCIELFCSALQPVLIKAQIATEQEIENTYMALIEELRQSSFQGTLLYHAVWGAKGQI
jgi:ubiquinone/menaquinone biosynthesis C-methylase UbiE